jgi:hypothetical protein
MSKYTESDLQAMAALTNFGSFGPTGSVRKAVLGTTKYRPSDKDQFSRLMAFELPNSEQVSPYGHNNAPVQPTEHVDRPKTEDSYTEADQRSFDRIVTGIEDSSVFKSPPRSRSAAEDVWPKYETRDLEAFVALGGGPVEQDEKSTRQPEVGSAPRYAPPQRPTPRDYFGIKIVDADAERGKERRYFAEARPTMKIVFSDAVGKKR